MKAKKWIAYTIYTILILMVFLYLCFPSGKFVKYIETAVTAGNPDIILSIDSARPGFPPGIRFHNIVAGFKDKPDSTIEADLLTVRPGLLTLLTGKRLLLLNADAYEGNIEATAGFAKTFSTGGPIKINAEFSDVDIGKCSYLKEVCGRRIAGRLEGSFAYDGKYRELMAGAGSAEFTLLDGSIQLLKKIFGFDKLVFDSMKADLILKNRTLKINGLNLTGKELNGDFKGNIFLDDDIGRSRLDVKGKVKIPALNKRLSIVMTGTIADPTARIR